MSAARTPGSSSTTRTVPVGKPWVAIPSLYSSDAPETRILTGAAAA